MTESEPYANRRANRVAKRSQPSRDSVLSTPGMKFVVAIGSGTAPNSLGIRHRLIHDHSRHGLTVFFLFGRVHAVRFEVDRQRVHRVLHPKILHLAVMVRVTLVKHRNRAAVAGDVDTAQTGIKLDHAGPTRHFQKRDGYILLWVEPGAQSFSFAGQERTGMLRID